MPKNINSSKPASEIELSKEDSGKQVTLHPGDGVTIRLRTNPTTGYDWIIDHLDPSILLEETHSYQVMTDTMGSPSDLVLHYKTVGCGTTRITLHYKRRWEKDILPIDTFTLDLEVKPESV